MDMYSEIKKLNERVERGELDLLEIREELRRLRAERLTDTQLATALAPDPEAAVEGDEAVTTSCSTGFAAIPLANALYGKESIDEPEPAPHTPERRGPGRPKRK